MKWCNGVNHNFKTQTRLTGRVIGPFMQLTWHKVVWKPDKISDINWLEKPKQYRLWTD